MSGHRHNPSAATQNQGNSLGDRSCVRQSKLYRQHEGGNSMKAILGTDHLSWDADQQQGAYGGRPVYDHNRDMPGSHRPPQTSSNMGAYTDSSFHNTYETTSGGYGSRGSSGAAPRSLGSAVGYGGYESSSASAYSASEGRMNASRGTASSGMADSLQSDSSARGRYSSAPTPEPTPSFPLNKMRGEDSQYRTTHRDMRDQYTASNSTGGAYGGGGYSDNSSSLGTHMNRGRGGAQDNRSTRPW
jgi:hypothetical protein